MTAAVANAAGARLDLAHIEAALRSLQGGFEGIPAMGGKSRDPIDDMVVANMLAGYAYIGALAADGVDPFAMGQHKELLELNRLVLCGIDPERRARYAGHLAATERRFYEERDSGIEDVVEWQREQLGLPIWQRAAGVYIRILCKPQLFIEGNHRTASLIMSLVLLASGEPPFVLTPGNATTYFAASVSFGDVRKHSLAAFFRVPGMRRRFAAFLQRQCLHAYLRHG